MSWIQPIADRMAQNLEIIPINFQFSTRRTRIPMGFFIYYLVLIENVIRLAEFWFVEKVLEIISRFCTTLSAIGCTNKWVGIVCVMHTRAEYIYKYAQMSQYCSQYCVYHAYQQMSQYCVRHAHSRGIYPRTCTNWLVLLSVCCPTNESVLCASCILARNVSTNRHKLVSIVVSIVCIMHTNKWVGIVCVVHTHVEYPRIGMVRAY